jgi:anthranilate synthase component 1
MTDGRLASLHDDAVRVHTTARAVPHADPLSAYLALAKRFGREEVYLLESAAGSGKDRAYDWTGFCALVTVSVTRSVVRVEGVAALREAVVARIAPLLGASGGELRLRHPRDLWQVLRAVRAAFRAEGSATRFRFGFLGFFGYDAARYIEDLPYLIEQEPDLPDVHLALYQGCLVADRTTGRSELLLHESGAWPRLDPDEIVELLGACGPAPAPPAGAVPDARVSDDTEYGQYVADVKQCKEHIGVGDIYQVQIGHELSIQSPANPLDVYRRLRERNASPYMYLATLASHTVIGASPELFVRVENGAVTMRPIAGTAPRGAAGDEVIGRELRSDPKEIAEHAMLLDLCRNDMGRICQRDTLDVPEALVVERYSHVLHLVSTVVAQVEDGKDSFDIIAALFPAGTMTGAPKIRAMEIIEDVERSRRGLYAGTLGLIDVGGYVNLALCIRTLIYRDGTYRTRASAGIVADSVPDREWTETIAKSNAAYWAVTGGELM